jgi:hypothetical protein
METKHVAHLSDSDLAAAVEQLARSTRDTTATLITHLAEFDSRRLHLGAGFSSLFQYCRKVLHFSEHEAFYRIVAARTARRFPVVFTMLKHGSMNLTTVRLLAPHLTAENHVDLLAKASGQSKRKVLELLARRFPRPDVPSTVRKLPPPRPVPPLPEASVAAVGTPMAPPAVQRPAVLPPALRPPLVAPLAPDRYEVRFTMSAKSREKLQLAQDLLRHAVPNGDTAEIVDRALTALLEQLAKSKCAATPNPRSARATPASSRHIPAAVKRMVWLRDAGRCAFVGAGRRCTERAFLEFHHVTPYAVGGVATADNIQLRCRPHNRHEADLYYKQRGAGEDLLQERGLPWPLIGPGLLVPARVAAS